MLRKSTLLICITVLVYACSTSTEIPGAPTDSFNRKGLLEHVAEAIIIPSIGNFNTELITLKSKVLAFNATPNSLTLEDLRTSWFIAYKAWQHVEMFNVGKANELAFVNYFNVYPTTVADIEANVIAGAYDLEHPNNHDAQGFPALDYLIYGLATTDAEIIEKYTTDSNAANYKKYLLDVITKMESIIALIVNDWNGSYKNEFINNSGNTTTSSLKQLVNDYVFYIEKGLRAKKIGIPAGNFSDTALPEKVEGFYKQTASKELALEALRAVNNMFGGNAFSSSTSGLSFKAYLEALDKGDLATMIENQFHVAEAQVLSLDHNFYTQINTNNSEMTKAYDELQKIVVLLKVDMLQTFNIGIDYVDADGD